MVRGPYERLKYDFRRQWECPECGHRSYTSGDLATQTCDCGRKATPPRTIFMRLVAEGGRRTDIRPPGAPHHDQLAAPRKGDVLFREQSMPTMPATESAGAATSTATGTSGETGTSAETGPSTTQPTVPAMSAAETSVREAARPEEAPPRPVDSVQPPADSAVEPSPDTAAPPVESGESAEPAQQQKGRRRGRRSKRKRRRKGGQ
jgi:hypothetical protein